MTTTKDLVLVYLRKEKIRLWLSPYYCQGCDATNGNMDNANGSSKDDDGEALTKLAESIKNNLLSRNDENSNDGATTTTEEILDALRELQYHAVQKLIDKNSVDVKIVTSRARLASTGSSAHVSKSNVDAEAAFSDIASWGDAISIVKNSTATTIHQYDVNRSLCLRVTNISPTLTVREFSSDICRTLNAKTVRIIWKGKNLLSSSSGSDVGNNGEMGTLRKLLAATSISGNASRGSSSFGSVAASSSSSSNQKKKSELLCLVSGTGYVGPPPTASSTVASSTSGGATDVRTDSSVIESIRAAARTIQNSPNASAARFEVTDQSGNLVPMRQSDTVAFLTALGLHRIGRSKMERQTSITTTTTTTTSSGGDNNGIVAYPIDDVDHEEGSNSSRNGRDAASALVFLLEADAEWNNSPALHDWKSKVDNYGLLQLDIAWCYLLLESLDGLDDAIRRLDVAERALRKQVHRNFVTLALAQAEMNNAIPPLCAVFVRLFLLQGVANRILSHRQNGAGDDDDGAATTTTTSASEEGLSRARLLCQRLRSSSPPDSVEALCRAYIVEPSAAIAALRRANGDPDTAGNFITTERDEEGRAARKRRRQRRAGRCANGVDFVDLDLVVALSGMLGYGDGSVGGGGIGDDGDDDDDDDAIMEDDEDRNNDNNNNESFQFDFCGNGESSSAAAMMQQHQSRIGRTANGNVVTCCTEWRGYRHATEVLAPFGYSTDFIRRVLEKSSELAFGNAISTTESSSTTPPKQLKTKSYQYNPTHSVRGTTLARPEGFCLCIDNDYIEHATFASAPSNNFTKPPHASQHRVPNCIDEWMNDYDKTNNHWPLRKDLGLSPAQRKRKKLNLAKALLPRMVMSTRRKYPLLHRFAETDAVADEKAERRPLPFERRQRAVQFLNSDRSQAIKLITPAFECGPTTGPVTMFVVGITTEDGCFLSGRSSRFELGHLYPLSSRDMQHDTSPIAIATGKMESATGEGQGSGGGDVAASDCVVTYGRRSTPGSHTTASSDDDDNNSSDSERSMHCLCKFDSGDPFNPKDLSIEDPSEDCIHRGCTGPGLWHCYVAVFDGKDSVIRVDGYEEPKRTREHYGLAASDEEDDDVDNPMNAGKCVGSGFLDGLTIGSDHQFDMSLCYGEIEGECGQGAIAELAVFKGRMDESDIEKLENYLMQKHGILSVEEKKEFIARENSTRTKNHPLKIESDLQEDEWKKQANALIDQRRPWNLVGRMPLRVAANHPSVAWHRTNDITGAPVRISRIGAKSSNGSSDW